MLECKNLSVFYGQHHALDGVSIRIEPGEIVVILGANGAGKSTLLKAIGGIISAEPGSQIHMDGVEVTELPAHEVVETGLALVPEGRGIFSELSVLENLRLGAFPDRADASENANLDRVLALFPKLNERKNQIARTMSGGEQQMVAIGRAMMSAPSILMLDEPSLGLSPILCSELFKTLQDVRKTGVGILLVEQNAKQSLAIADRGYLLEVGRITGEDTAERLMNDPAVQKAYLGGSATAPTQGPRKVVDLTKKDAPSEVLARGAANEFAITPQPEPRQSINSGQILSEDISAIVNRAVEVETRQQETKPVKAAGAPSGPAPGASAALQRVLDEMEQSARAARYSPAREEASSPNLETAERGSAVKPVIEIYRKPKVEVYRRQESKTGVKMVKVKD